MVMVSAGTLHVVSTELTVGSFAMAGAAFLLAGIASHGWLGLKPRLSMVDAVAHFALAFGLLALPFAIITGIQSSPGDGIDHPLRINKMLLASASFGLAIGVLMVRRERGIAIWNEAAGRRWQSIGGMAASGLILLTASIGGTFTRGESLLDLFQLPYGNVPLMPMWLSAAVIVVAAVNLGLRRRLSEA